MKRIASSNILAALTCIALLSGFTSCQTPIQPGNDPVVVRAEQTIDLAKDTIDTLEQMEYSSYATLKEISPDAARQIRLGVNTLRRKSPDWLQTAFNAKQAYKLHRTADNKANLDTAIEVVKQAIADAEKYISQIKSKTSAWNQLLSKGKHLFARLDIVPEPALVH